MGIEEFIERYGDKYEYNWDEYDTDRISIYSNSKTGVDVGHIVIEFFCDNYYSIYREFLYEDQYSPALTLDIDRDELLFKESLKRIFALKPQTDCDIGYGCPFFSVYIGFWEIPFSWENLERTLESMEQACLLMNTLTLADVDHTDENYITYIKKQKELLDEVIEHDPSLRYLRLEDSPLNLNHRFDSICAYIDERSEIITGSGLDDVLHFTGGLSSGRVHVYFGFQYFIIQDEMLGMAITSQAAVDRVLNIFRTLDPEEEYDLSIKFSLSQEFRIVVSYGALWAVFRPIKSEHQEFCLTREKNYLKTRQRQFLSVAPKGLWECDYDFAKLDDEQFEYMCRDLLAAMGFQNVHLRGKTHTPDGGVDITADDEYQTTLGREKRTWIFQCKHTKHQIDRKDISEVPHLLKEFRADCYGLFYSGILSPATLDRIDSVSGECRNPIKYWDSNDLEIYLKHYPQVYTRYFVF